MMSYLSLHATFRNNALAKFLCCQFLVILSDEHPGYRACLFATRHNKQRSVLNLHTLMLWLLEDLNYTRPFLAWECIRKSSFAEQYSDMVVAQGAIAGKST